MRPNILIVDDHQDIIRFLKELLESENNVLVAENGQIALDILKSETVHVVISDVMMPVMDGFALCEIIKSDCALSHIPVILLTAKTTLQSKVEGLELGADVYIEKPFSPRHLLAQISSLLTNRFKIKEHYANSPLTHLVSMAHTKADEIFLEQLNFYIDSQLSNPDLSVEDLAKHFFMSRPTFYRKINVLTNLSPKELVNVARLKKAAAFLLEGTHKIAEVVSMVGFSSQSYFTQAFFKQFGTTPTHFVQKKNFETGYI
jgi:DNA-binding response OmpR family regulator